LIIQEFFHPRQSNAQETRRTKEDSIREEDSVSPAKEGSHQEGKSYQEEESSLRKETQEFFHWWKYPPQEGSLSICQLAYVYQTAKTKTNSIATIKSSSNHPSIYQDFGQECSSTTLQTHVEIQTREFLPEKAKTDSNC